MASRANILDYFDQVATEPMPHVSVRIVSNQPDGVVGYAEGNLALVGTRKRPESGEAAQPTRIGALSGIFAAERVAVSTTRTLSFVSEPALPLMFSNRRHPHDQLDVPFNPDDAERIEVKISRDIWSRIVVSLRSLSRNVETKFRANCRAGVLTGVGESLTGDGEASYLISVSGEQPQ
jgi:hypothetical protein